MDDIAGGDEQVLVDDTTPVPVPQEPIPVDPTTPPSDVIRALGYDPELIQSLVITATHVVAVAADYPEPQTLEEA
ncbi:hypothetical protein JN535_04290 [Cellulosimicrobium cellulans]|uniref:hypothetical protein n=1 Tax=Cellulosimicrobium cellulans TaxID=1710 RepID=UPI0019637166|nr:hypothetical protein [Cellulosimicrobium cellulans]MBN0039394.1 hypothetical protein [Cellulosimicrobium cellulans]